MPRDVGSGGRAAVFFMDEIAEFPRAYDSDAVTGKYALPDLYVSYQ